LGHPLSRLTLAEFPIVEYDMFVILGSTGKVGRTTIKQLRSQGAPVRAVVRKSSNADDLSALGCEIAAADLNDAAAIKIALRGADAVQVICPVQAQAEDAAGAMGKTIDAIVSALSEIRPAQVLAISDYGAEVSDGTGITMIFHYLEEQLRRLPSTVTFLRSAEHMQNWARVIKVASETGVLPSLHHPLSKRFPTVSAPDVGSIAAQLLTDGVKVSTPRVVHAEGPRRYDAHDVAATLGHILGREIVARELPQSDWIPILTRAGAGPSYARLIFDLYVAHNAGRIDVEPGATDIRFGTTELRDVFVSLLGR
jgi:NAD(P)H dehydrogenase (quinone)